ncbi:BnaCnng44740D [Brassica napus]|uniref:BnaCnng44740D protein n=2 Tax=Brassica napus TaxID=3708 RepID=A0A078JE57_BRANA|nr:BnaCnng44740D [Brassica napus]
MSATTAIFSLTNSNAVSTGFNSRKLHCNNAVAKTTSLMKPWPLSFSPLISPTVKSSVSRRFDTLMEWQECKVRKKVEVPVSVAYGLYSERESIPRWMTFISSVKVICLFSLFLQGICIENRCHDDRVTIFIFYTELFMSRNDFFLYICSH